MVKVYLALGANQGDRKSNLLEAIGRLGSTVKISNVSSFYETDPVGYENQPLFLNGVCEGETDLSPDDLLKLVKAVEEEMGRKPSFRNAPRPIDIDIIFYGDQVWNTPELEIPHPRLAERFFVLVPLVEIAPDVVHPVLKATVRELLERLGPVSGVRSLEPGDRG